jgi:hypothetical protein
VSLATHRLASLAPGATLDYGVDAADLLAGLDDTLASVDWEVPAGLTAGPQGGGGAVRTIWLTGVTPGAYRVVAWLNTAGGRRLPVVLLIDVLTP